MNATVVTIKQETFRLLEPYLSATLSVAGHITSVDIQERRVTFANREVFTLIAETTNVINRFEICEYLLGSPRLFRLELDEWLTAVSEKYKKRLVLKIVNYAVSVDMDFSR